MEFKKICKNPKCGIEFSGTKTQQYCCIDCRTNARRNMPKTRCTLDEVAKEAKELGMSYGKYVAMKFQSERKKK